ncbi:MAG: SUMF1/EgtB/PvdO family nonheme iron enzyme, partial [Muribaculaceae bacterium]|nr:SUMF1/EgtB/PvdO family nonheme iron enzyme [Muribaculaceae bacterium]
LLNVSLAASSQISVKSFKELDTNLDATTYYPQKDINGKTCAIIKIFTTQTGFSFDNGSLGIVAVEQKPAEVWVYVPEGTMKLKITHPQLGHISNSDDQGYYWIEQGRLKSGKEYKMEIVTGTVRIEVEQAKIQTGWLVFNSVPEGADIYLAENGGEEKHIGTTPMNKKMPYGTYNYRAKRYKYHDDVGIARVDKTRVIMDLKLKPAFGSVSVSSQPQGAKVFLDGEDTGKVTPCTIGEIASGRCDIRLRLKDYAPASQSVTVTEGMTASVNVTLEARFAHVTINSLPGAAIKVNGAEVGSGSYSNNMAEGIYDIEASLAGHRPVTKQIEVIVGVPQTIELRPTPIYGMLDVNSNPMGANITINGKSYGDTPTSIENLLVGDYDVVLTKPGYASVSQRVTVSENASASVDVKMQKGEMKNSQIDESALSVSAINLTPNWSASVTPSQRAVLEKLIANMVKVEGSTFTMGATPEQGNDAYEYERPAHQVTLSDYYIGRYEVTQKEWQAVMGDNPSKFYGDNLPVDYVSWNDCQDFINKLNQLTGLKFRLPTEAEWEFAARGGKQSKGYKYSGSDNAKNIAWYEKNSGSKPHQVGTKEPNELGIYDMSGNVGEWCGDWYGRYSSSAQTNPTGPSSGSGRVLRGGGWSRDAGYCRVSDRSLINPSIRGNFSGFRVVLVP